MRRFAFHELRRDRERFTRIAVESAPPWMPRSDRFALAYGRAFTGLRFLAASDRARRAFAGAGARRAQPARGRARARWIPGRRPLHGRRPDRGIAVLPARPSARGTAPVRASRVVRPLPRLPARPSRLPLGRG